jgi:PAT family beta-lactamase induction signal transducer AmpG
VIPYGASFGFVSVALPFVATHRGISVHDIGAVIALASVPHGYKFLWSPLVDTTLTRKTWLAIALAVVVVGTFVSVAMPLAPATLGALTAVVVLSQFGLTLVAIACQALMASCLAPAEKGRGASFYQAGVFVGGGVGGGAALWLSQHLIGWQAGAVVAATMLACSVALRWVVDPAPPERPRLIEAARALGRDIKSIVAAREGRVGVLVCLLPVGAGAANNLFGALALSWHASEHVVELSNGLLGGVAAAGGAVLAGRLADRLSRLVTFAIGGSLTAAAAGAMGLAPQTAGSFVVCTLAYQVAVGVSRAAFVGVILETIGAGAVATKYSIFASLLNLTILYTVRIDVAAEARWGGRGLLLADATLTAVGIGVLLVLLRGVPKLGSAPAKAP